MSLRIASWNMESRAGAWHELLRGGYDLALLQEAGHPPADVAEQIAVHDAPWSTGGNEATPRPWRCAVVGLSAEVQVRHLATAPIDLARYEDVPVSRTGTFAVAEVRLRTSDTRILFVSMHALYELPRVAAPMDWIYADASAHRLVSDLSALVGSERRHHVIVGADLNLSRDASTRETKYWQARHGGVFARMAALGIPRVGPDDAVVVPVPAERRTGVPTYRMQADEPSTATKPIDHLFASDSLGPALVVRALNDAASWGPSSHCRIEVTLDPAIL